MALKSCVFFSWIFLPLLEICIICERSSCCQVHSCSWPKWFTRETKTVQVPSYIRGVCCQTASYGVGAGHSTSKGWWSRSCFNKLQQQQQQGLLVVSPTTAVQALLGKKSRRTCPSRLFYCCRPWRNRWFPAVDWFILRGKGWYLYWEVCCCCDVLFYDNMSGAAAAAAAAVRRFYPTAVAETPGVTYMTMLAVVVNERYQMRPRLLLFSKDCLCGRIPCSLFGQPIGIYNWLL